MNDMEKILRNLPTSELLKIVQQEYQDYSTDALDCAVEELKGRAQEGMDRIATDIEKEKERRAIAEPVTTGRYQKTMGAHCCECGYTGPMAIVRERLPVAAFVLTAIAVLYLLFVRRYFVFGIFEILLWLLLVLIDVWVVTVHRKRELACPQCKKTLRL